MAPPRIPSLSLPPSSSSTQSETAFAFRSTPATMKKRAKKMKKKKKQKPKTKTSARTATENAFPGLKFHAMKPSLSAIVSEEYQNLESCLADDTKQIRAELVDILWWRRCRILIVVSDWYSWGKVCLPFSISGNQVPAACTRPSSLHANSAATGAFRYSRRFGLQEIGYRPLSSSAGEHGRDGKLVYMSVDSLLEEMVDDRDLSSYYVVIVEDAHLRTLSTDVLLGMLALLSKRRRDLRIVLKVAASAEHEAARLSAFFHRKYSRTQTFLVPRLRTEPTIVYVEPQFQCGVDPTEAALAAVLEVHRKEPPGRMVLFLPGCGSSRVNDSRTTVDEACRVLRERILMMSSFDPEVAKLVIMPVYDGTPTEIYSRISKAYADPVDSKKLRFQRWVFVVGPDAGPVECVGVRYVVDPGIGKDGTWISKQSADERSLISATVTPDRNPKCFRLYRESVYRDEMAATPAPEILTCGSGKLSVMLGLMMQLGVAEPWKFDFIDPPPPQTLASAMEHLSLPDLSRLSLG